MNNIDALDAVERAKQMVQRLSMPNGSNDTNNHGIKRSREDDKKYSNYKNDQSNYYEESRDPKRQAYPRQDYNHENHHEKPRYGLGSDERRQKDMEMRSLYNQDNRTVSVEYLIPNHMTGLIIGRGGESLKRIESNSRCKVQIPQECNEANRRLTIIGQAEDVEHAKQIIKTMIDESENRPNVKAPPNHSNHSNHYGPNATNDANIQPAGNQITIPIPRNIVGLIIGRHGDTIRDIAMKSGAKLNVLQNSNTDANVPISIAGEQSAIDKARAIIDELVAGSNQVKAPNSNVITRHMPVHKDLVGLVIGKKGETIRLLNEKTGCKVFVDQTEIPGTNQKNVNITGPANMIDDCQRLIEERLQASTNPRTDQGNDNRRYNPHDPHQPPQQYNYPIQGQNPAPQIPQPVDYYQQPQAQPQAQQPQQWDAMAYAMYYQSPEYQAYYNSYYAAYQQDPKAIAASASQNPNEYIAYYAAVAAATKQSLENQANAAAVANSPVTAANNAQTYGYTQAAPAPSSSPSAPGVINQSYSTTSPESASTKSSTKATNSNSINATSTSPSSHHQSTSEAASNESTNTSKTEKTPSSPVKASSESSVIKNDNSSTIIKNDEKKEEEKKKE